MTPLCQDIEVRPQALTPLQRAKGRDSEVRAFEKQWADWASIAGICIAIDRDKDWELLGYRSFGDWMVKTAPKSRAYLYLCMGRYRELILDIPEDELREIPLGSAGVLKQVSTAVRRDPEVRKAAKQKPAELREKIRSTHPEQLIENIEVRELRFTASAATIYDEMLAVHRTLNNPETSAEEIVEQLCVEWLNSPFDVDAPCSNRERAAQLEGAV